MCQISDLPLKPIYFHEKFPVYSQQLSLEWKQILLSLISSLYVGKWVQESFSTIIWIVEGTIIMPNFNQNWHQFIEAKGKVINGWTLLRQRQSALGSVGIPRSRRFNAPYCSCTKKKKSSKTDSHTDSLDKEQGSNLSVSFSKKKEQDFNLPKEVCPFENPHFFRNEEQHTGRKERNQLCRRLFDRNTIRMKVS